MKLQCKTFGYCGAKWVCYYYLITFWYISFGVHVDMYQPNIEIHLPFGFLRIGRVLNPVPGKQGFVWGKGIPLTLYLQRLIQ